MRAGGLTPYFIGILGWMDTHVGSESKSFENVIINQVNENEMFTVKMLALSYNISRMKFSKGGNHGETATVFSNEYG